MRLVRDVAVHPAEYAPHYICPSMVNLQNGRNTGTDVRPRGPSFPPSPPVPIPAAIPFTTALHSPNLQHPVQKATSTETTVSPLASVPYYPFFARSFYHLLWPHSLNLLLQKRLPIYINRLVGNTIDRCCFSLILLSSPFLPQQNRRPQW